MHEHPERLVFVEGFPVDQLVEVLLDVLRMDPQMHPEHPLHPEAQAVDGVKQPMGLLRLRVHGDLL